MLDFQQTGRDEMKFAILISERDLIASKQKIKKIQKNP